jgi:hypothetical protein
VHARSTTVQVHPSSIDAQVAHVRDDVMPALLATDGCIGLSMLVNHVSGRCIAPGRLRRLHLQSSRAAADRRRAAPGDAGRAAAAGRPHDAPVTPAATAGRRSRCGSSWARSTVHARLLLTNAS